MAKWEIKKGAIYAPSGRFLCEAELVHGAWMLTFEPEGNLELFLYADDIAEIAKLIASPTAGSAEGEVRG